MKTCVFWHGTNKGGGTADGKQPVLFEPSRSNKFLSYAAPAIHNAMMVAMATAQNRFECCYASVLLWLDSVPQEDGRSLSCFVAAPYQHITAQIYLRKETIQEMGSTLKKSSVWLLFRFWVTDDMEHSVAETARHVTCHFPAEKLRTRRICRRYAYYLKKLKHGSRRLLSGSYHDVCVPRMTHWTRPAAVVQQRHNTHDFASKVVRQQVCFSPPLFV